MLLALLLSWGESKKGEWKEAQPRRGKGNPLPALTPGPLEKMV